MTAKTKKKKPKWQNNNKNKPKNQEIKKNFKVFFFFEDEFLQISPKAK